VLLLLLPILAINNRLLLTPSTAIADEPLLAANKNINSLKHQIFTSTSSSITGYE